MTKIQYYKDNLSATDKMTVDPNVDDKPKAQNCQNIGASAITNKTKYNNSNDDKRNGAKPNDNEFDGNYGAALKSNLNQTPTCDTNCIDLTKESEPGQFGATSDLYVYIAENG